MPCRVLLIVVATAYALALVILALGTFGHDPDPLAGVYLVLLGMPWNLLVDHAPEPWWPWLAATAPLANLAIVAMLCGAVRRLRA